MGVRPSDQNWKRQLNELIAENQPAINKIMLDYGVPLLNDTINSSPLRISRRRSHEAERHCWRYGLSGSPASLPWSQDHGPGAAGYRMQDYRGPTPTTLAGARVVTTGEAEELWKAGAAFVDVLPHAPRPANLPPGTIWHEKPRMDIPGSIWLPDTGYGALAAVDRGIICARALERVTKAIRREAACYLLSEELLDVLERRQARAHDGLHEGRLVPGRHRWLASGGLPLQESRTPGR